MLEPEGQHQSEPDLTREIARLRKVDGVPRAVTHALERLCSVVEADIAAVWRRDEEANVLRCVAIWHRPDPALEAFAAFSQAFTFGPGIGLPGRAWARARRSWIPEIAADRNFPRARVAARASLRSAAGWPIRHEGEIVGVLECFFGERREPDAASLRRVASVVRQLGTLVVALGGHEAALASEARKASIIESAPDGIVVSDGEGAILDLNAAAAELLGYERSAAVGLSIESMLELTASDRRRLRRLASTRAPAPAGLRVGSSVIRPDGSRVKVEPTIARVRAPGPPLLVIHIRDITERQRLDDALRWERDFLSAVLDTIGAIVLVKDPHERVIRFNRAAEEVSGYSAVELRSHETFDFLIAPESRDAVKSLVSSQRTNPVKRSFENDWIRKDGTRRHIVWSNTSILGPDGSVAYTIAAGVDVTERRVLERRLAHHALHDPVTGLANRQLFEDRLEHALKRARRGDLAVLIVDMDNFRIVNELLGHAVGDALLRQIARRIGPTVRDGDTLARLGGDAFALLLEEVGGPARARAVAARLLRELAEPFSYATGTVSLEASIGIAYGSTEGSTGESLVREAEIALGWAKRQTSGHALFDPLLHQPAVERRKIEERLLHALDQTEFRLRYQPVVELKTGRIVGAEALLRWQHPERGLLAPGDFLDVAEEMGLMVRISSWVLGTATRQAARWRREHGGDAPWVSVNLSPRLFIDPELAAEVERAVRTAGLPPQSLVLEITEELAMQEGPHTAERLDRIRQLGVRVAIDDFGTGYSSLSYLQKFAVDILKIDQSLLARIDEDQRQRAVIAAICDLGRALDIVTIAEGIERREQREAALAVGCQLAQGFHLSRPIAAAAVTRLLRSSSRP